MGREKDDQPKRRRLGGKADELIASMQAVAADWDFCTAQIDSLMTEAIDFALDSYVEARRHHQIETRMQHLKVAQALTNTYLKLTVARDKHIAFVRKG